MSCCKIAEPTDTFDFCNISDRKVLGIKFFDSYQETVHGSEILKIVGEFLTQIRTSHGKRSLSSSQNQD